MSVIEIRVTPTHRYFARKRKDDIILRIEDMKLWLGERVPDNERSAWFSAKRQLTRDELASEAMALVRRLPE